MISEGDLSCLSVTFSVYRPIALLPVFSQVIKKVMARALNRHLENNLLYSDKQHGYRQKRSTVTALIQLQEDIVKKFEEGKNSALLYVTILQLPSTPSPTPFSSRN